MPAMDLEVATAIARRPDMERMTIEDLPRLRAERAAKFPPPDPDIDHVNHMVRPSSHESPIRLRVHRRKRPADSELRPCLFWIHGGGYVLGSDLSDEDRLDAWVHRHDCVAVSVDYRLAPEHPFPAALDDCMAGLEWVFTNGPTEAIDISRVVVAGISAGGGLAAALSLLTRDRGTPAARAQLLIYPMLDDRWKAYPSSQNASRIWGPRCNDLGWRAYLSAEPGGAGISAYAAAGRAEDLTDLPPTFIGVAALDVLRDEDLDFAARMLRAGNNTELHVYAAAPHGFERAAPDAAVSRRFLRDIDEYLAKWLSAPAGIEATNVRHGNG